MKLKKKQIEKLNKKPESLTHDCVTRVKQLNKK